MSKQVGFAVFVLRRASLTKLRDAERKQSTSKLEKYVY